jgi:S1-C subfamily serine protease
VLGINAQIKTDSGGGEGVGFAVPVDAARRSLRQLRLHGRVDYAYLGVTTLTLWPQLAERLDLPVENGALVQSVDDGSPADDGGIRPGGEQIGFQGQRQIATGGDVIVAVDGVRVTREHDLSEAVGRHHAGDRVTLTVLRDGRRRAIPVTLASRRSRG